MNVACSSCPAKYAVPDEKVRGRKVRITCKRCGAAIIVDGTELAAGTAADAAPAPAAKTTPSVAGAPVAPRTEAATAAAASQIAPAETGSGISPGITPPPGRAESDIATTVGPSLSESASADRADAEPQPSRATRAATADTADRGASTAESAEPAGGAKPVAVGGKPGAVKPVSSVAKPADAKLAFPKLGGTAGKGPMVGGSSAGAANKVATSVVGTVATGKSAAAATPGKTATAAIGTGAAKPTPLGGAATANNVSSAAARGAGAAAQAARAVVPRIGGAAAPAVAPRALPERTWTVAVTDDDHHEMTLAQILEAYAGHKIDAETFIWRDGMPDWLMPFEIGEIATALRARRLVPRTNAATAGDNPEGVLPSGEGPPPGAWREPGRWDRSDSPKAEEPSFDDVTVAMEGPKAKALLQAVSSEDATAKGGDIAASKPSKAKGDEPTMLAPKGDEPTTVTAPGLTSELLAFGGSDAVSDAPPPHSPPAESITAIADSLEREPERLPFELAPSATAARAALRSSPGETEGDASPDLFARATTHEGSESPDGTDDGDATGKPLTGARNESSVLFSLDQLARPELKKAEPKAPKKDEAALLLGNGAEAVPVAKMGAPAGLFGSTHMAAPDFTAPPPPSVPPAAPRTPTSAAPAASTKRSAGAAVWVGVVVALAALGGAAYFLSRSPATPATAPTAMPATAAAVPSAVEPAATAPGASETATATAVTPTGSGATAGSAAPTGSTGTSGTAASAPSPAASAPATAAATPSPPKATQPTAATPKATATAEPAAAEGPEFDKDAAMATLATAGANAESQCAAEEGPHGTGKVTVTFANSGRATNALVSGDFAGSALGGCVARIFRSAKVPAFGGDPVRVSKTVRIP